MQIILPHHNSYYNACKTCAFLHYPSLSSILLVDPRMLLLQFQQLCFPACARKYLACTAGSEQKSVALKRIIWSWGHRKERERESQGDWQGACWRASSYSGREGIGIMRCHHLLRGPTAAAMWSQVVLLCGCFSCILRAKIMITEAFNCSQLIALPPHPEF